MDRRTFVTTLKRFGLIAWVNANILEGQRIASRPLSSQSVNVRDFGARGDGKTDDTSTFNRAMHSLASNGGTVIVPSGDYLINPLQSILLVNNITLALAAGAILRAIGVRSPQSAVIKGVRVKNVTIRGGVVIGERFRHTGVGGEWGMGIDLRGCVNACIEDVAISECWGDGIYIGVDRNQESQCLSITNCVCRRNRRQGLSITGCIGAIVRDSDFSDMAGTAPQSGIDIEPNDPAVAHDIEIINCTTLRNAGFGISLSGVNAVGVSLVQNRVAANGVGLFVSRALSARVETNLVENNRRQGIIVTNGARGTSILGNTVRDNGRTSPLHFDNVYLDSGALDTTIADNVFMPAHTDIEPVRYDVRINSINCVGTRVLDNRFRPNHGLDDHGRRTIVSSSHSA